MRLTNIPVKDQMLLFADGQVPDVRKSVLDQCWKEPVRCYNLCVRVCVHVLIHSVLFKEEF